jgi:AcrR family transcriptional regulator
MTATRAQGAQRQRNPRGQGERLREDIIEAASRLLADPAAPPLSLRSVAREAGVAATSVYLHFDDVDSLLLAVVEHRFSEMVRLLVASEEGLTEPCAILRAGILAYCEFGIAHPGHYRVMFADPLPVPADADAVDFPGRSAFSNLVKRVAACIGCEPSDQEAWRTAVMLWQLNHGTVNLRISRPGFPWPPLDETVTEAVDRLVAGARTRLAARAAETSG